MRRLRLISRPRGVPCRIAWLTMMVLAAGGRGLVRPLLLLMLPGWRPRAHAVESAQGEADAAAAALYRDRSAARWRGVSGAAVAANAGDYNRRVSEVDAARKALADGRASFYPTWVSYVSAHDAWRDRVDARDAASARWESAVAACMGGAPSVSPSPSPSTRPSPSPSPSASAGVVKTRAQCEREVVKPVEMTVDVGVEPSAPAVPSGVTVPASWPQPRR